MNQEGNPIPSADVLERFGCLRDCNVQHLNIENIPAVEVSDTSRLPGNPLVSVDMITFNHERYIDQAIRSIVNQQTAFDFELVIGEDCSKDRTRQIVLEYQRRYPELIRVVMSDENVGPIANQLRVERACRGKYIAYCEGDDFWQRSDKLQVQVDFLEAHPECSVVYSGYTLLKSGTATNVTTVPGQSADMANILSLDDILFGNRFQFATCTTVGRRAIIERAHALCPIMSEDLSFGDVTRHLLFAAAGNIGFVPQALGTYRINEGGVSQNLRTGLRFVIDGVHVKSWFLKKYRPESKEGVACLLRQCFPYIFYFAEQRYAPELVRDLIDVANACGYPLSVPLRMKLMMCRSKVTHAVIRWAFTRGRHMLRRKLRQPKPEHDAQRSCRVMQRAIESDPVRRETAI